MARIAAKIYHETDRSLISTTIALWCRDHGITAYMYPKEYMRDELWQEQGGYLIITTTFWEIPDERDQFMFILKWG